LEESATVETLLATEIIRHGEQASLDLTLPLILRIGIELVAGNDLRWNGCMVLHQFGRHQRCKFFVGQLATHGLSSLGGARWRLCTW
jgi:hypothetical protein